MKSTLKKQVYAGIMYGMIPLLFFSCSASHPSVSSAPGKQLNQDDDSKFKTLYYNGLIQKTQSNLDDAMRDFRQCLTIDPLSPAANFEVAQLLEYDKQHDSALV